MNELRKIDLLVKQTELETGATQIIYQGKALRIQNDAMCSLTYTESQEFEVILDIFPLSLVLARIGETTTILNFDPAYEQEGSMATNYGVIPLKVLTDDLEITSSRLRWSYRLTQDEELIGAYASEWTMEETA
ncbi:MAG: DUF1934 domain-containing protein [Erysipelotrichales bacterium]|nr:MAG: DUF1934 domain-containing protein [Erysipelotrichales bacterium]